MHGLEKCDHLGVVNLILCQKKKIDLIVVEILQFYLSTFGELWCEETGSSFCCSYCNDGALVCVDVW